MKKIQVSTVKQLAEVEVIFMNTTFVAKVLNAANNLRKVRDELQSRMRNGYGAEYIEEIKALAKVDDLFTEFEIAFGIKEEPQVVESKEDPSNANVPSE